MTPTMTDVGARAGVSAATVSGTLDHPEQVCESRRDRVRLAVAELGYVLNLDARRLRVGASAIHEEGR